MLSGQSIADQDLRSVPEGVNLDFPSEYGTGAVELPAPDSESGLRDNQKELDLDIGPKRPRGKIWGMKRKTFTIVLGVLIFLIIAVVLGVGGGVGWIAAKSNAYKDTSESNTKSQGSSIPTGSSPSSTSSGDHLPIVTVTSSVSSSPTPTPIRKNTPLAAINWDTSNIQLLYKHTDGSIRARENNGLKWEEESLQITNLKPKDDSGFAAVGWFYNNVLQVRVYTVSESNALWESVWNSSTKSWYSQDISKGLDPVGAGSHLTAYTWIEDKTALRIRVYYQRQDGYIREAAFDNGKGWGKGVEPTQGFPQAKSGTGLAIVRFPETNGREAKLFYQSMGGKLVSLDYKRNSTSDGSWQNQDPTVDHGSIPDGTHLTAVLNGSGEMTLRIYFIRDGKLVEIWWTKKTGWVEWDMHDAVAPGVAAVSYSDDVHIFFQTEAEYFSEVGLNRLANKWQFIEVI